MASVIIAMTGCASRVTAQAGAYPRMAADSEYLMPEGDEIRLARSAAPAGISGDATILVLRRQGYEVAEHGTNGFVCMVGRSWLAAFDWPEFWNPKVRAADCMNRQAARVMVPIILLRSRMVMEGRSKEAMLSALRAAVAAGRVPRLERGAMDYMMSRSAYLTDEGEHNAAHVMLLTTGIEPTDWGSGVAGAPIMSAPYWFFSPPAPSQQRGLPAILVFLIGVPTWSDGTPATDH